VSGQNRLVWLELEAAFDWSNYKVHAVSKPSDVPHQAKGNSFSRGLSDTKFLVFGGEHNASYWLFDTESLD
jgi:hypothetical protein